MDTIIYFVAQIVLALTAQSAFRLAPIILYSITVSAFQYFLAAQSVQIMALLDSTKIIFRIILMHLSLLHSQ